MKTIESIPNAHKTFTALKSLGYDLNSAIADIIDNSISARAKTIKVRFNRNKKGFRVAIVDDGFGMDAKTLQESMRLGTDATYEEGDLGKFGMGMKTASLSNCNILTVVSKQKNSTTSAYQWNLLHIKKTKEWALLQLDKKEIIEILKTNKNTIEKQGTIVFWDDVYIIDKEYVAYGSEQHAENYYNRILRQLILHLRMVFHRFLDGSNDKKRKIKLTVNGISLNPWDPFCREEKATQKVQLSKELTRFYPHESKTKLPIIIQGYVLPTKEEFSSKKNWEDGKGTLSWNDAQGYYIYRADRMIRFGGWHSTRSKDEHDKLARLSIDIPIQFDSLFRLTVNKSRVHFPESLYNHLKENVNTKVLKEAKNRYRKSEENGNVTNKFRFQSNKLNDVTHSFLIKNKITIGTTKQNNKPYSDVIVKKPDSSFISNSIRDIVKYGMEKNVNIISGRVENDMLWKLVCNPKDQSFSVIINKKHPFYQFVYEINRNKVGTTLVDAMLYTMAFAELYTKSTDNGHLFEEIRKTMSDTLAQLTREKLI